MRSTLIQACSALLLCVGTAGAQQDESRQIAWQRTLEDALALVEASGKPLLVITNDPQEPLSNRLANRTYRTPEFVKLTRGFVPVLASPLEDGAPEYDNRGRRRPSSLYGRVLTSEHVRIEPKLYERYFDGNRVAPRHLGVSPDGEILFDVFLTNDVSKITGALSEHGRPDLALPAVPTDDLDALLASPDAANRELIERLMIEGTATIRRELALAALSDQSARHPQVVRLALRDLDADVRINALRSLAEAASLDELEFLPRALQVADQSGRPVEPLLARFESVAEDGMAARPAWADATLTQVRTQRAVHTTSQRIPEEDWLDALWGLAAAEGARWAGSPPSADRDSIDKRLGELEAALRAAPADQRAVRELELAEATLDYARVLIRDGADPSFALSDCVRSGRLLMDHEELGQRACRLVALAGFLNGEKGLEEPAIRALELLLTEDPTSRVSAELFDVLSNRLRATVYGSSLSTIDPATISDASTVCRILPRHPLSTLDQSVACLDFFAFVGARDDEASTLQALLKRFPTEVGLHERFRSRELRDGSPQLLLVSYGFWVEAQPVGDESAFAAAEWFAGVAAVQAASLQILDGDTEEGLQSARRAERLLDDSAKRIPSYSDSVNHWAVFALSAEARAHLDLGDLDAAAESAVASLQRRPASTRIDDWLGTNPRTVATNIADALESAGRSADAGSLRRVIGSLDDE